MKKIAILNIYQGMVERGAETLIDHIAQGLAKDFDITVFSGGKIAPKSYKVVQIPGMRFFSTDVSKSILTRAMHKFYLDPYSLQIFRFTLLCLPKLIRGKFDIIITINGFWQLILLRLFKLFTLVKIVSTGFAGVGKDAFWNAKLTTDGFIGMTEYAAGWAKNINPKIKIFTIGGGVDLERFTTEKDVVKVNLERPIVLCVSALVFYKRVDLAIRAVAKLEKGSLLVIGNGAEKEKLEILGQKLLGQNRFKILKVAYSEIDKYYRACDVFTLPSKGSEAFGIVYLEAMATSLPVVAPNDEVREEVVNGAGILINVENIEEYAAGLKKALATSWGEQPRKQAEKFSWEVIVKKYKRMLNSI